MPVSYQDFVLSNQYFGTPMPTDPKMKMELTPIVYENMRTIGARPSRLQQGLRAVGRGLAIAGGAGVAVGVANSLFNKPSDNYGQAVTDNQTSGGRNTRVGQLDSFDEFFETDNEKYAKTGGLGESSPPSKSTTPAQTASITAKTDQYLAGIGPDTVGANQYDATIGPHSLASATGIGRKPRIAKLGGSEFSQALRYGDPAANLAAAKADNTPEYQISDKDAADIAAAENMPASPTVQAAFPSYKTKLSPEERARIHITDKETNKGFLRETEEADRLDSAMGINPPKPPSSGNISERVEEFINKSNKGLPEKKTPKVTDIGEGKGIRAEEQMKSFNKALSEGRQDITEKIGTTDLSEIENDSALADIGRREEPQDVSPRGVIPPDKSGTMNKTDLSAIGDIIGEKQADNPIIGGLQGIGKAARIAGKIGKRTVEELADKGAKDRRSYAKYKETMRKAEAFKKIAEDRKNTNDPE
jgi:hypothetical protein